MMTTNPQPAGNEVDIFLKPCIDPGQFGIYLSDIFSAWERGRQPLENVVKTRDDEWQQIIRRTGEFCAMIAVAVLEEAAGKIADAAAKNAAEVAFADGLAKGQAMGALKPSGKRPALPSALPRLDSEAIVKTIGGELRKMFEAGLEQGKSAAEQAGWEVGKLQKPSGEVVRVQRNGAGEIVGAVKQFVYDEIADG